MSIQDITNGSFEILGGLFIVPSILRLYKDKTVKGISMPHVGFFLAWGYWNLYYYPHLGQWASFIGGLGVITANTVWVGLMVYYTWLKTNQT